MISFAEQVLQIFIIYKFMSIVNTGPGESGSESETTKKVCLLRTKVAIFVVREYSLRGPSRHITISEVLCGGTEFIWNLNYVAALSIRAA